MTSTSRSSRSWTACEYSARVRRWNGRQPGFGLLAANSSIRASSAAASWSICAASGRLAPGGGIIPARSLRIIFSMTSGCSWAFIASKLASDSPPALPRSL